MQGGALVRLYHRAPFLQQHDEEHRITYNRNPTTVRRESIRGFRDVGAEAQTSFYWVGLMPETNVA